MNQKIKVSQGIQYVILGLAVIIFLLIWPMGVIHHTEISKSGEEILRESDPISVANNGTQMFIAEGTHLKAVDLYVANDMQKEAITFRVYDGAYQQLWETFYVVDEKAVFPGFVRINIDMDMEEGWEYYYTVEGLTSDLVLYYEDTNASTSFANGTYLYGGEEMPGINLVIRYVYTESFAWWITLLAAAGLVLVAFFACKLVDKVFEEKLRGKNKEITVQKLIQWIANPIVVIGTLVAFLMVYPGKMFGVGAVNYGFYYIGIAIAAMFLLYAINYKRKEKAPLISKVVFREEWQGWLMAVCFAGVLWSCYEYMNGLYTIHHTLATCRLMIWFFVMLLCTFSKEQMLKVWNLVYVVTAFVWGYFYTKPYIGIEGEEELYKLQAYVIALGVFVILQILISILRLCLKKEKVTVKISIPYAILLLVWMTLMIVYRNTREWVVLMAVLFGMFYFCLWRWEKREKILAIFGNGVILNFVYMVIFCLMHRPYLRFRHNRFGMGFHTVTMTGYYLALVLCAVVTRMLVQYKKTGRWRDCFKEWILLGVGNVYLFLTLSRTGYLAAFVMQIFIVIFFSLLWEKNKLLGMVKTFAVIIGVSVLSFPMVFTAQRILPAIANDPIYSEIEIWDYVVEKGDPKDSELYMDIQAFIKVAGNKLFGIEMGNISLSSIGEEMKENLDKISRKMAPVYVKNENYMVASEKEMYEEEDISNGRFEIFSSYMEHWNMTGHEEMGVPLPDGSIAVHAHNTFLQLIHDHGMITGIVFIVLGIVSFFVACIRYAKEKDAESNLILTVCVIIAFAAAGMVEWIFQICNPFGIAILVVVAPLLFKSVKSK